MTTDLAGQPGSGTTSKWTSETEVGWWASFFALLKASTI